MCLNIVSGTVTLRLVFISTLFYSSYCVLLIQTHNGLVISPLYFEIELTVTLQGTFSPVN